MRLKQPNVIALFFTLVGLLSTSVSAAPIPVTVYADNSYPPYSYSENGEVKGLYAQILKVAFSRMPDYAIKIQAVPWKRGLRMLESGTGFALYPPYFHLQKRPYIWPYSLPILDERVVVFCQDKVLSENPRSRWPKDYYGLTIGINAGFHLGGEEFWQAVNNGKIKVIETNSNSQSLNVLGLGRTDCYINDRLSIQMELKRLESQGKYAPGDKHAHLVEGATITLEQGFLGYTDRDNGKFAFKPDFQKQFDVQIYEMRRSGELQNIIDQFTY
ncbi:ABC transporter substrate-binding protein [Motiliproteus sp. MSK22-1]|uniref:substrate-binding periplasmic protein n=1 Tax=Motiliproteus sp. MSK22-1 TaxID=1897630 RepID=UPI0009766C6A|nr:transporter substrate-binding domain-containing protein [Motiliproteus sp. MSK22-1]OMH39387.1 ABC transporter substrate-binding protein [Motiliproteus sp. MSK22-1]